MRYAIRILSLTDSSLIIYARYFDRVFHLDMINQFYHTIISDVQIFVHKHFHDIIQRIVRR